LLCLAYNRTASCAFARYARRSSAVPVCNASGDSFKEAHMNKQDIIAKIAADTGITKTSAAAVVESVIDGITRSLKKGDSVSFVGFGTFKISNRKARLARNPQTGAAIKIPKRRVPRFSAGKALKQAVK